MHHLVLSGALRVGPVTWGGRRDEGARMSFRMRAGDDGDPNNYWRFTFRGDERSRFGTDGKALKLRSYQKLESGAKAGITHDTQHWRFWTTSFDFAEGGGGVGAQRPRQFVQLRADFESTGQASSQLDYLQFAVSIPPVVSMALAEIAPVAAPAGEIISFTYKIKSRFLPGDLGFDSISIDTPVQVAGVAAVRIGGVGVDFSLVETGGAGFTVRIPPIDTQLTDELIEVDFRGEVFKFGTIFTGQVFNSEMPHEVVQGLMPGDADPFADGDRLQVDLVELGQRVIQVLRLSSLILTPNGDGINDRLRIEYDLLNLAGGVPVRVVVYDLAGYRLGKVKEAVAASGRSVMEWDGRAMDGSKLGAGIYILRFEVDADNGLDAVERVVSIAY